MEMVFDKRIEVLKILTVVIFKMVVKLVIILYNFRRNRGYFLNDRRGNDRNKRAFSNSFSRIRGGGENKNALYHLRQLSLVERNEIRYQVSK